MHDWRKAPNEPLTLPTGRVADVSSTLTKKAWKERAGNAAIGAMIGGTTGAAIGSGVGGHLGEEHRGKGLVVGGATGALAGGLVGGFRGKNIGEWLSKRTTPSQTTDKATEGAAAKTTSSATQTSNTQGGTARTGRNKKRRFDKNKKQNGGTPQGQQQQGQNKTSAILEPPFGSFQRETLRLSRLVDAGDPQKTADISASLVYFKQAAMALPSIPTPQFPTGLAKITPRSVSAGPIKPGAVSKSTNATQVHSQPPVVNQNPYQGVKAIPPPSVKR